MFALLESNEVVAHLKMFPAKTSGNGLQSFLASTSTLPLLFSSSDISPLMVFALIDEILQSPVQGCVASSAPHTFAVGLPIGSFDFRPASVGWNQPPRLLFKQERGMWTPLCEKNDSAFVDVARFMVKSNRRRMKSPELGLRHILLCIRIHLCHASRMTLVASLLHIRPN